MVGRYRRLLLPLKLSSSHPSAIPPPPTHTHIHSSDAAQYDALMRPNLHMRGEALALQVLRR